MRESFEVQREQSSLHVSLGLSFSLSFWCNTLKQEIEGTTDTCPEGRGLSLSLSLPYYYYYCVRYIRRCIGKWRGRRTIGQVKRAFAHLITTFRPVFRRLPTGFEWKDASDAVPNAGRGRYDPSSEQMLSRWSTIPPPFLTSSSSSYFFSSIYLPSSFFLAHYRLYTTLSFKRAAQTGADP